ncbi:brix domain-containing 1 [Tribonema minus]|uniref:Ribosome production factor 2 homolog n=1 Tax=Tribonema minus TaxID=303371 RepID=A0A835ZC15_9STRA|nr:brix domain-containing 1 [Tribonema minus]
MPRQNIAPKQDKGHVRRAKEARAPKVVENTKTALCIRGKKTSESISTLLTDMYRMKKPFSRMLGRRNDLTPFDDETGIEFLTTKNDSSLFLFGSHNKKRPNNIVLGRTFDGHILDMMEMGVTAYRGIDEFRGSAKRVGSKPAMLFEGDLWENEEKYRKLRNLLIDFFRGDVVDSVSLAGLDHVMVVTAVEGGPILLRHYLIAFKRSGTKVPHIQLERMGPHADLVLRRVKFAATDLWKVATRKPKQLKPKKVKNVTSNTFETVGRIHLGRQDLSSMNVRRVKALRSGGKRKRGEEGAGEGAAGGAEGA